MARRHLRFNVTLDEEHATKLTRLAERAQIQEGTLARSLLSQALDDAAPDPRDVTEILDAIPGALARARRGLREAKAGKAIALDDL